MYKNKAQIKCDAGGEAMLKIAAIVGNKDESTLIGACISRLIDIGVDNILIIDDGSTDGSLDIIREYAIKYQGRVECVGFSVELADNLDANGTVLGPFLKRHCPDWVLFIDSDEFLLSLDKSMPAILSDVPANAVAINRFNVPLTAPPIAPQPTWKHDEYLSASIIVKRQLLSKDILSNRASAGWIQHKIAPKVICRYGHLGRFMPGAHEAISVDGSRIHSIESKDLIMVHVPFSTFDRFSRKVANTREFFKRWIDEYPGEAAWHWKRWIELDDRGLLHSEFLHQVVDEPMMGFLRNAGAVASVREYLLLQRQTGDLPPRSHEEH